MKSIKTLATALAMLVALLVPASAWAAITPTKPTNGNGRTDNPYQITNEAELFWFAGLANGTLDGVDQHRGASAKLMNDITLTENWTPIGSLGAAYYGGAIFDGNNKTVRGVTINDVTLNYAGFFGYIWQATVKNLNLADVNIVGNDYIGGICGYYDSEYNLVNCTVSGSVTGNQSVGGLLGWSASENIIIEKSVNNATVTGNQEVGGIVGYNYSKISNCVNNGEIVGVESNAGGICALNYAVVIEYCKNNGAITQQGTYAGGICGYNYKGCTITKCENLLGGTVTSKGEKKYSFGGICGYNQGLIEYCNNAAEVTAMGQNSNRIGGICGEQGNMTTTSPGTIAYCFNTGEVKAETAKSVGGVIGENMNDVSFCYNSGSVSGKQYVGGLCGYQDNSATVSSSYNIASVVSTSGSLLGGLVGFNSTNSKIVNCYYDSSACSKLTGSTASKADVVNSAGMTTAQFNSGEVATLINKNAGEVVFRQNIGTTNYPNFTDEVVYFTGENTYGNANLGAINSILIKDDHPFIANADFTAASHTNGRTVPGYSVSGGVIPFSLSQDQISSGIGVYTISSVTTVDTETCIDLAELSDITAHEPFILINRTTEQPLMNTQGINATVAQTADMPTSINDGAWSLIGTTEAKECEAGHYEIGMHTDGFAVGTRTAEATTLAPFRAILKGTDYTGESIKLSINGTVTGVVEIEADGTVSNRPVDVYTISGVCIRKQVAPATALEGLPSGIYIVGGKKIMK